MKNIKQIIKEELNNNEIILLKTFQNKLCDKQKNKATFLYDTILNDNNLNWFLLKTNKYKNINISYDKGMNFIIWKNGIWIDGIWNDGSWHNGTWINGEWKTGFWHTGIWYNGIWNSGYWKYGIWNYGEWIDGKWDSGYWLDGKWNKGKIWNTNLQKYVETKLNPAEYYKIII